MASFQITDRPETTSPLNDDNFLMQNSGTGETKRVTFGNLTGPFVAQIEEKIFEVGNVEKRQTVLYGSIDSSGYANFLTGNGAATLTLDATPTPVVVTWASGDVNYKATISADLTLDISGYGNGTYYAYVNYNSGTPTLGAVSLVPTDGYGAASTTANQHHFRIPEMKMYVGNGSAAVEVLRVFVGEFVVASGVIQNVAGNPVTYALRGEWESGPVTMSGNGFTATGLYSLGNHNIGSENFKVARLEGKIITVGSLGGYSVGDIVDFTSRYITYAGTFNGYLGKTRMASWITSTAYWTIPDTKTGGSFNPPNHGGAVIHLYVKYMRTY